MKTVERAKARVVADEIKEAVGAIMEKHGLAVKVESIKFGFEFACKIRGIAIVDGKSAEQMEFENHAFVFGLKESDYGRTVKTWDGTEYKVVGIRPKASKKPIIIETLKTGKRFVIATTAIKFVDNNAEVGV